jgi:hypothetical protein
MEQTRVLGGFEAIVFSSWFLGIADVDREGKHPLYQRGDILAEHLDI